MRGKGWNSTLQWVPGKTFESTSVAINDVKSILKGINHRNNGLMSINNKLIKRKDFLKQLNNHGLDGSKQNFQYSVPDFVDINANSHKTPNSKQNFDVLSYNLLKAQGFSQSHIEAITELLVIARDQAINSTVVPLSKDDTYDSVIDKLKSTIKSTYVDRLANGIDTGPCEIAVYIKILNSLYKDLAVSKLNLEAEKMIIDRNIAKNTILLAAFTQLYYDYPCWKLYRLKDSKLPILCLKKILPFDSLSKVPESWLNEAGNNNGAGNNVSSLLQQIKIRNNAKNKFYGEIITQGVNCSGYETNYQLENFTMPTVKQQFDFKKITVKSLASHFGCDNKLVMDIAKELADATSLNSRLTLEESEFIAQELGFADKLPSAKRKIQTRPPIVAIMGHVDHGKTTLLDSFRNCSNLITSTEVGGITQKLGAFQVNLAFTNKLVTFIDTPGHSAFTTMRSRGSSKTDIIILVIAADDGVMPQTIESYQQIVSAGASLIVAINKIDRVTDTTRVKNQILSLVPESTPIVEISAKYKTNIDQLERAITEIADGLELRGNYHPESRGNGFVLETGVNGLYGKQITVIVTDGVLKENSWIIVGNSSCKIRKLLCESNRPVPIAYPSDVVSLIGLSDISAVAGHALITAESQKEANKISSLKARQSQIQGNGSLQDVALANHSPELHINFIIKCVDQGSLDAIVNWINEFNLRCRDHPVKNLEDRGFSSVDMSIWRPIKVLSSSVGPIAPSDIQMASINKCYIITFSVDAPKNLEMPSNCIVKSHNIIYNLFQEIENIFNNHFGPLYTYTTVARMRVTKLAQINVKKKIKLAIGTVSSGGVASASHFYSILRNGVTLFEDLEILSMHVDKCKVAEIPKNNSNNAIVFKQDVNVEVGDEILAQNRIRNECVD